ncbi:hypothetical protein CDS [Bradyrhizobium sp.]|nr:hypothetical protein CDS [Bradyrhizobium sp.]
MERGILVRSENNAIVMMTEPPLRPDGGEKHIVKRYKSTDQLLTGR